MELNIASGFVNEKGRVISQGESDFFDFIELRLVDGTYKKLHNVLVAKDCIRGLKNRNVVTFVTCDNPDGRSRHFPTNSGTSTIYAVYSETDNRLFDDVGLLTGEVVKLDRSLIKLQLFMWIAGVGLGIFAMKAAIAAFMSIFGFLFLIYLYFTQYVETKKLRSMSPTADEIKPYVDTLRRLVKPPAHAEPLAT